MTRLLDARDLDALFTGASRRIVRVEALESYDATDDTPAELAAYRAEVTATVARGVLWERLRVIDTPPTGYQRWELDAYLDNQQAGETIRIAERRPHLSIGCDVWLFDDQHAAVMRYTPAGALARVEAVDSLSQLRALAATADMVRDQSVPLDAYLARRGAPAVGRAS